MVNFSSVEGAMNTKEKIRLSQVKGKLWGTFLWHMKR